jgi:hypothetical protein
MQDEALVTIQATPIEEAAVTHLEQQMLMYQETVAMVMAQDGLHLQL